MLEALEVALAGRPGARLAAPAAVSTSRDSLLRMVRALPDPPIGSVEVLGVDDSRCVVIMSMGPSCSTSSPVRQGPQGLISLCWPGIARLDRSC